MPREKLETVAEHWERYSTMTFRGMGEVSDVQYRETRKAFFAGAFCMLLESKKIGDDSISEDAGILHLEGLSQELERFHRGEIQQYLNRN
jgi:hypothetical protein